MLILFQRYIKVDDDGRFVDFRYDVFRNETRHSDREESLIDRETEWFIEVLAEYGSGRIENIVQSSTHIKIETCIKGVYLNFVAKHLCQQIPDLDIRLLVAESGYESAWLVVASKGIYQEQPLEITDETVAAFEGQPFEIDQECTLPSRYEPSPPFKFFLTWRKRRLERAVCDYPIYTAPHPGYLPTLSDEQVEANFHHFMLTREDRIAHIEKLLFSFGVKIDQSFANIKDLDRWIFKYGAFLTPRETGSAYETFNPAWAGPWRGLNVVFDIATLLGEHVVKTNPNYSWGLDKDVPPGLRKATSAYRSLVILRDEPRWIINVLGNVKISCDALRERSFRSGKPRVSQWKSDLQTVASYALARPAMDDARLEAMSLSE